jgi:hypothetical protein
MAMLFNTAMVIHRNTNVNMGARVRKRRGIRLFPRRLLLKRRLTSRESYFELILAEGSSMFQRVLVPSLRKPR